MIVEIIMKTPDLTEQVEGLLLGEEMEKLKAHFRFGELITLSYDSEKDELTVNK